MIILRISAYFCNMNMTSFEKKRISLRYWLLGMANANPEYNKVLKAMEFAALYHKGTRKDLVTPEFEHQLTIAHYIRTLSANLMFPVESLCVAFLHDVCEDYDVPYSQIELEFGIMIAKAVETMTKVYAGRKKSNEEYFEGIAACPIASINKGGDRIHNLQSMPGVFNLGKQKEYIDEAETHIIPAIKIARRNFPQQELAYENIKLMMTSQIQLLNHLQNG